MENDQENHLLVLALVVDKAALKLEEGNFRRIKWYIKNFLLEGKKWYDAKHGVN